MRNRAVCLHVHISSGVKPIQGCDQQGQKTASNGDACSEYPTLSRIVSKNPVTLYLNLTTDSRTTRRFEINVDMSFHGRLVSRLSAEDGLMLTAMSMHCVSVHCLSLLWQPLWQNICEGVTEELGRRQGRHSAVLCPWPDFQVRYCSATHRAHETEQTVPAPNRCLICRLCSSLGQHSHGART